MGSEGKRQNIILPTVLAVSLLLFLVVGGFSFTGYLRTKIMRERTSQLEEITSQVRLNLRNALESKWEFLTAQANTLERGNYDSGEDVARRIGELERIFEMESSSALILIDSEWSCYGADQKYGIWPEFKSFSWERPQQIFIYEGRYWVFVRELSKPIQTRKDNLNITHAVLFQDAQSMKQYYDSEAYEGHNEIHILKSDGTRMYDYDQNKLLRAYNILNVLENMDDQSCPDIRQALAQTDTVGGRFYSEGEEYYYCVTSLEEYDTLLLFLIPADYVASETVKMVDTVIRTLLFLAVVLLLLSVFTAVAVIRQRSSSRLVRQEQANLHRQEELYADLESFTARLKESNARLSVAKAEAEQAFRIAEEANRAKSSFLSNMSHDIRTPMNAIVGFLALLRNEADNPEAVLDYSKRIDAASQHLLGLINDVLDMSKIESGSTILNDSDMNLAEIVNEINAIIRPQTKAKSQTFDISVLNLRHEYLIGDKLRINQILINLLSNAMKYTPEHGSVRLRVEELAGEDPDYSHIRFIVSDSGIGMKEEYLKIIFEPFTREQTSTASGIQGTGLGMAITKNLIDLMGGTICVESKPGKGSIFTVELKLRIQEQTKEEKESKFLSGHRLSRMLITDSDGECRSIAGLLSEAGIKADYSAIGENVVRMMYEAQEAGQPYDLLMLDWKMQNLDRTEAVRFIRKSPSDKTPLLLLTARDWSEIEQEAMEIGSKHFLPKPFLMSTFKETVRRLRSSSQKEAEEGAADVLKGLHVLVVDDIAVNRIVLIKILTMLGARIDIAENGQEAVEKFGASRPGEYDLILMDVQMPVMDGYSATRAIRRSKHPSAQLIPIIAMTANAFVDDVQAAIESGMDAHIAKPVQVDKLKSTVGQVLDSRKKQSAK